MGMKQKIGDLMQKREVSAQEAYRAALWDPNSTPEAVLQAAEAAGVDRAALEADTAVVDEVRELTPSAEDVAAAGKAAKAAAKAAEKVRAEAEDSIQAARQRIADADADAARARERREAAESATDSLLTLKMEHPDLLAAGPRPPKAVQDLEARRERDRAREEAAQALNVARDARRRAERTLEAAEAEAEETIPVPGPHRETQRIRERVHEARAVLVAAKGREREAAKRLEKHDA